MLAIKLKNNYLLWLSAVIISVSLTVFAVLFFQLNRVTQEKDTDWDIFHSVSLVFMEQVLAEDGDSSLLPENISKDHIRLYREYYGDLDTQLGDISRQYMSKIIKAEDQQAVKTLEKERDTKLHAIINNFSDDKIVQEKIFDIEKQWLDKYGNKVTKALTEKTKEIDMNYFYYIVRDNGAVLTNVSSLKQEKNHRKIKEFFEKESGQAVYQKKLTTYFPVYELGIGQDELFEYLFSEFNEEVTVTVGMKKEGPTMSFIKQGEQRQQTIKIFLFLSIVALLIGCFFAYNYINGAQERPSKYVAILKKIPLDGSVLLTGMFSIFMLFSLGRLDVLSWNDSLLSLGGAFLLWAVFLLWTVFALITIKELLTVFREEKWTGIKRIAGETLMAKIWRRTCVYYQRLPFLVVLILVMLGIFSIAYVYDNYRYSDLYNISFKFLLLCLSIVGVLLLYRHQKFYKQAALLTEQSKKILMAHGSTASPLENLKGLEINVTQLGLILDEYEKSSRQNEGLKHELLTNVSHDLRTPLTSLITYSQLLQKSDNTLEEQEKYRKIISDKSLRMKRLIDNLFEVTKMNNGEVLLNKSTINMKQLLEQAIAEYEEIFKEKNLKLMYYKPHESIEALADGDKIWRVMDNLFSNAAKYTMSDTRIHLKLQQQEDEILLEMKNIANYELNQEASGLVERFRRGDNSRNTEGFGLGLAIANSIIELHQGTLQIIVDGDMFKILISIPV
ncbi:sensor histidine kinase [Vagococcus elongatus]|uniref:histidine kinase n=1 Tax=Vagococcus elongatus TaxID=180344 RepID=A0A430B4L4_9ENTE|nr:HAMP domain-containing sensor histidine kinase [Vagococcus elongatus]RSU15248.1 hypothetical protein CBF29_02640 [Vagococcus elongatus]